MKVERKAAELNSAVSERAKMMVGWKAAGLDSAVRAKLSLSVASLTPSERAKMTVEPRAARSNFWARAAELWKPARAKMLLSVAWLMP